MKFNDNITLDIAKTVKDVMEGKVKKEEVKYPHMMYAPDGSDEVEVKDKAEHEKYAAKGYVHKKPKSESPEEPKPGGEKAFKDKHVVKKSGEKEDGTVVKEEEEISEATQYFGFDSNQSAKDFYKKASGIKNITARPVTIVKMGKGMVYNVPVAGNKEDLVRAASILSKLAAQSIVEKKQVDEILGFDGDTKSPDISKEDEIERERLKKEKAKKGKAKETDEESEKQKKYQAFFNKTLKKFGVKSPDELDDEKKKEFFDYIDKNYEADNESD